MFLAIVAIVNAWPRVVAELRRLQAQTQHYEKQLKRGKAVGTVIDTKAFVRLCEIRESCACACHKAEADRE